MNTPTTPTHAPAEALQISPEALELANCYLQLQDAQQVAQALELSPELVTRILDRPEVRAYVDRVFFDTGFNNRHKMRRAMDALIQKKFQDLEESQTGSTKDIADLLALSHKMSMELLDRQLQLEKIRGGGTKTQTNIQINNTVDTGYQSLLNKLLES
jgi:hypothetical protein